MSFLRRLLPKRRSGGWPPPGPITAWPTDDVINAVLTAKMFEPHGDDKVEVVGESQHRETLERIAGGATADGPASRDHVACLIPEPSNPDDADAVRVFLVSSVKGGGAGKVGHLSRQDATAYRPVIDRVAASGKVVACRASLEGSWDRGPEDRGGVRVTLHVGTPHDLLAELDGELGRRPSRR